MNWESFTFQRKLYNQCLNFHTLSIFRLGQTPTHISQSSRKLGRRWHRLLELKGPNFWIFMGETVQTLKCDMDVLSWADHWQVFPCALWLFYAPGEGLSRLSGCSLVCTIRPAAFLLQCKNWWWNTSMNTTGLFSLGPTVSPKALDLRDPGSCTLLLLGAYVPNLKPCSNIWLLKIHSTPRVCVRLTDLSPVPRNRTQRSKDRCSHHCPWWGRPLNRRARAQGDGTWNHCPGLGSPGHGGACPPGRLPLEACGAWTRMGMAPEVALPAAALVGPGARTGSPAFWAIPHLFWVTKYCLWQFDSLADGDGWALVRREMGQNEEPFFRVAPICRGWRGIFCRVLVSLFPNCVPAGILQRRRPHRTHSEGVAQRLIGKRGGGCLSGKLSQALGRSSSSIECL